MKQPDRNRWRITLAATIATVAVLIGGATAYWQYVNYVPPFRPQLPKLPSPNGYLQAARILEGLSQPHRPPVPKNWPRCTPAELERQLNVVRPVLSEVRRCFQIEWRRPPILTEAGYEADDRSWLSFRECGRCFVAQSIWKAGHGDDAGAMHSCLDAMELGARSVRGGGFIDRSMGVSCHAMGFRQAEAIVPRLPETAVAEALSRVRRIRSLWPACSEMLEAQRSFDLWYLTTVFERLREVPLGKKLAAIESVDRRGDQWDTIGRALTPRQAVLSDAEQYYRTMIDESKKPVLRRTSVEAPTGPWSNLIFAFDPAQDYWRSERASVDLSILEVALAARMHYLEHGRYPTRLFEISKRWLPAVPLDLWDHPIAYRLNNRRPVIYSLGPDGKDDGGTPTDPSQLTPATRGDLVFGHLFPVRPRK